MSLPRGIRNNNPGNIRQNNIQWQGMSENPFDPHFVEFKEPVWGYTCFDENFADILSPIWP